MENNRERTTAFIEKCINTQVDRELAVIDKQICRELKRRSRNPTRYLGETNNDIWVKFSSRSCTVKRIVIKKLEEAGWTVSSALEKNEFILRVMLN